MNYMNDIFWLAAANAVVWFGLGSYIAYLATRQRQIIRKIKNLELINDQDKHSS